MQEIIKIISEHKKIRKDQPVKHGFKRVMATFPGGITRHVDIPKSKN